MENQNTTTITNQLSDEFSRLIVEAFTADQLAETIAKNNTAEYAGCCATHGYCDSNMVMNEAFENVMNRPFIFFNEDQPETKEQNEQDTALINNAWMLSKSKHFAVVPCLSDLDANGDIAPYSDDEEKRRRSKITASQIIKDAEFTTSNGDVVKIIEVIPNYYEDQTAVKTFINGKGTSAGNRPYCDEISELLEYINE